MINPSKEKSHLRKKTLQREIEEISESLQGHNSVVTKCSYCNSFQIQKDTWREIISGCPVTSENYNLSHGICPMCAQKHFPKEYIEILKA